MIGLWIGTALAMEPPHEGWPMPMHDPIRGLLLVDQLEVRGPDALHAALDAEGWLGGDYHRLRYRVEGEASWIEAAGAGEVAALYSRLVSPWLELQAGIGALGRFGDANGWEAQLQAGIEYTVPYDLDLEAHLRVSQRGRVSARVSVAKEWMWTQRLITQARVDVNAAVQASDALDLGAGLPGAEASLRVRYEVWRELAPYVGVLWAGGTAIPGGDGRFRSEVAAVAGVRAWY